jgi:ribokinase
MFDVVSFGSAVIDLFVDTNLSEKKNFIIYPVGAKILVKDLKFDIGGGGTNTAVAFSRFGFKTGCICKIGRGEHENEILKLLKKEKVRFLGKQQKEKSGYSIILDSKEKSRTILTYKGINNKIDLKDIEKFKTQWLYYSSLLGQSFQTQIKLARSLKKQGTKLAFNPSSYLIKSKNISPLLKLSDILILNKEEAQMLTKKKRNLLEELHKLTKGIVVITDKDKKIQAYDGEKKYSLMPHKIKIVERTGAGDAFASGFVAGQIVNKTIQQSLVLALKESESVVKYFGAKNNLLRIKLK